MTYHYTFGKDERLTSKKSISLLFERGESFVVYPFRIVYLVYPSENNGSVKAGVTVSKKRFKKAANRNRIKRQIKEAYRKNKHIFYEQLHQKNCTVIIMFIFVADRCLSSQFIENKMEKTISNLSKSLDI